MGNNDEIVFIVNELLLLETDESVPKNVRAHIRNAILALEENGKQIEVKVDRALEELSEIDNNPNLQQYTRTKIWGVVSALEGQVT